MNHTFYRIVYLLLRPFVLLFYPISVKGLSNVPSGSAVLCGNHSSAIDPILIAFALPWDSGLRFMGKKELFKNKLFGKILYALGVFPVDRQGNDVNAMKTAIKCLQTGDKLILFPEGTRVQEEGDASAKGGAVLFSTRTGVPMIPVYCGGKKKLFHKSPVYFGEPYLPEFSGRRPTAEENHRFAEELLSRIYRLKEKQG